MTKTAIIYATKTRHSLKTAESINGLLMIVIVKKYN